MHPSHPTREMEGTAGRLGRSPFTGVAAAALSIERDEPQVDVFSIFRFGSTLAASWVVIGGLALLSMDPLIGFQFPLCHAVFASKAVSLVRRVGPRLWGEGSECSPRFTSAAASRGMVGHEDWTRR